MKIYVNGQTYDAETSDLTSLLGDLGFEQEVFATALNGEFVPESQRAAVILRQDDRLEIVSPMQGG
jgi:sulfur carrier protein